MATEFISTLRSSGGDYATMTAWEAAVQCNLTSASTLVFAGTRTGTVGDAASVTGANSGATGTVIHCTATQLLLTVTSGTFQSAEAIEVDGSNYFTTSDAGDSAIAVLECYNDWASGLDDIVVINGWGVGATNYIAVRTANGSGTQGSNTHNGTPESGFYIAASNGGDAVVQSWQRYTKFIGLEIKNTYVGSWGPIALRLYSTALVDRCICRVPNSSTDARAIDLAATHTGTLIQNSVFICDTKALWASGWTANAGSIYNSVFDGEFVLRNAYEVTVASITNCVVVAGGWFINDATVSTASNNASFNYSTYPPPGSNPYTSNVVSGDFVDAANDDFHLASGSGLIGQGANLYSDFQFDVDGDEWPDTGAWDIGFDYYVSAGGDITGTLAAVAPAAVAAFGGTLVATAALAIDAPAGQVSIAGTLIATSDLDASSPAAQADLAGLLGPQFPTLSNATAVNVDSDTATPKVTVTYH